MTEKSKEILANMRKESMEPFKRHLDNAGLASSTTDHKVAMYVQALEDELAFAEAQISRLKEVVEVKEAYISTLEKLQGFTPVQIGRENSA